MGDFNQTSGAGPLGIAAASIALIVVLVIKFKLHAFLTPIVVSLLTALATRLPLGESSARWSRRSATPSGRSRCSSAWARCSGSWSSTAVAPGSWPRSSSPSSARSGRRSLFGTLDEDQPKDPPSTGTVIGILVLPLVLIFMNTGLDAAEAAGAVDGDALWVQALTLIGTSGIALLISVLVAAIVVGTRRCESGTALEKIAAAYIIAVVLRLAQGPATVALVTAAGLMAPAVAVGDFSALQVACIVLATGPARCSPATSTTPGSGTSAASLGMDVKTTLKTWTVQQTLESVPAFDHLGHLRHRVAPWTWSASVGGRRCHGLLAGPGRAPAAAPASDRHPMDI